jgi:hypothetical protein
MQWLGQYLEHLERWKGWCLGLDQGVHQGIPTAVIQGGETPPLGLGEGSLRQGPPQKDTVRDLAHGLEQRGQTMPSQKDPRSLHQGRQLGKGGAKHTSLPSVNTTLGRELLLELGSLGGGEAWEVIEEQDGVVVQSGHPFVAYSAGGSMSLARSARPFRSLARSARG